MLDQYTTLLSSSHPHIHLSTAIADFCSEETSSSSTPADFDIAGVALGFHHFNDPAKCISNLYASLKKGGVLFIVDWLPKEVKAEEHIGHVHAHPSTHPSSQHTNPSSQHTNPSSQHTNPSTQPPQQPETQTEEYQKMQKTIKTNGFSEKDMESFFTKAGFTDFGFVVLKEGFMLQMNGKEVRKTGFIAKGRKG
jgi:ubiquinone/menaquinone biosynthesis C-methylase UbiE